MRSASSAPQTGQVRSARSAPSGAGDAPGGPPPGARGAGGSRGGRAPDMARIVARVAEAVYSRAVLEILVLAGGSGTRFWPVSRRRRPKQLLALEGERSLLQATVDRLRPLVGPERVWISTTAELAGAVREQLPEVPPEQILLEPAGRNTAPAIGWSLLSMPAARRAGPVAVLPADHRIAEPAPFLAALDAARESVAGSDRVVALGVAPDRPETGFGYLEVGEPLPGPAGLRRVVRFTEKPDLATAERFLAGGRHLWNAGIFVFRGDALLGHLRRLAPELEAGLARLASAPEQIAELYPALPSISIDHAVMEKLDEIAILPLACGWNDLGSWGALAEVLPADAAGNAARGELVAVEAGGNLVFAEQGTVALLGVSGLVVVRTGDAVLVMPKERAQELRRVVDELARQGRGELL